MYIYIKTLCKERRGYRALSHSDKLVLVPGGRSGGCGFRDRDNAAVIGVHDGYPRGQAGRRVRVHGGAGHSHGVGLVRVLVGIGAIHAIEQLLLLLLLLLLSAQAWGNVEIRVRLVGHQSSCGRGGRPRVAASTTSKAIARGLCGGAGGDVQGCTAGGVHNGNGSRARVRGTSGRSNGRRRSLLLQLLCLVLLLSKDGGEDDLRQLWAENK